MWFVSRQSYWGVDEKDQNVVEIAYGGIDYANPDMLKSRYCQEGMVYDDPREALEAAIEIARQWKQDFPKLKIGIAQGYTGGNTLPFEKSSIKDLRKWAKDTWEALPKCGTCGKALGEKNWKLNDDLDMGDEYCSEHCAEKAAESWLVEV